MIDAGNGKAGDDDVRGQNWGSELLRAASLSPNARHEVNGHPSPSPSPSPGRFFANCFFYFFFSARTAFFVVMWKLL